MTDATIPPGEGRGFFAWFTQNHVAATLCALGFVVAGLVALLGGRVRREVFPELEPNIVTIQVTYLGAAPAEVEQGICLQIEDAVEGISGVDKITATAIEGAASVVVEALQEADIDQVYNDVKNRIDAITTFPVEAERPIVSRLVVRREVITVAIHGDADEAALKAIAERARDELSALPEISQVDLAAVRPFEISIEIGEAALQRHGLTFDDVANAVRRGSLDLPAGAIKADDGHTVLRVQSQAYRGAEFADLVLLSRIDGTRVRLGDVATVIDGFADDDLGARFDGKPAVMLKVFRVGDEDVVAVTGAVKRWVAGPGKELLPPGVAMTPWRDESLILDSRTELLLRNAAQGLALVLLILTLFLQLRIALFVAAGIPIAFLGAVASMPALDVSVNMLSLFAFLLVLGIVVDDAIVVGENIVGHRERGGAPLLSSIRGAREVRAPVFASVTTTIAAFTPMLFAVPGADAQIWRVIPLIVIPVLLVSLIESQLCLPSHLALLRDRAPARREWPGARLLHRLQRGVDALLKWWIDEVYGPSLGFLLRWRHATIAAAVALLMAAAGSVAAGYPRFIFFPSVEGDNVVVALTMPEGYPAERTLQWLARIERTAREVCDEAAAANGGEAVLEHMMASLGTQPWSQIQSTNVGRRGTVGASGSHLAELNLQLTPSERRTLPSATVMSRMRERTGAIPDAVELTFTTSFFSTGKDVDVELYHADADELQRAAGDLQRRLGDMPEIKDVTTSFRLGKPELRIAIRPEAEALGLAQRDLARQVRQAFHGEEAQRVQRGQDDVRIMVRYPERDRRSPTALRELRVRTPAGDEVPFDEVATVAAGHSYSSITRVDGRRSLRVQGEIDENDADASPGAINARLRDEILPALVAGHPGLGWAFEGDEKKRRELLVSLAGGFVVALFAMFALIAIPLRSYLQTLIILTAVPFGFVGALLGHAIMEFDLSILSLFGLVALSGVVVNDNIVLVDWINHRREHHETLHEAVRSAGARRFRPILLTSLTTFGGLMPLLFEQSVQARFLIPMALSLGFGVVFATAISLVLVPCLYLVLEDVRHAFGWLYGRRPRPAASGGDCGPAPAGTP
ncbi:MAG: efflux RND transporter permease subunit [Planctomycetes bacterium]|nr:efflux RND transporter permease subunit [Planctomycetota bacterium]